MRKLNFNTRIIVNGLPLKELEKERLEGRKEMKESIVKYLYELSEQGEIFWGYDELASWMERDIDIEGAE